MGETVTSGLLRLCDGPDGGVELSPRGHEFALGEEYESVVAGLKREAGKLTGSRELRLRCLDFAVSGEEIGAGMPPVVSRIHQTGPDKGIERFLLHLLPDQTCFQGHFPGRPILAGVIQLHWAVKLAQACLDCNGTPQEILRLKYHNIAVPPRFVELRLEPGNGTKDSFRVRFSVLSPASIHAQGLLVFPGTC